MSNSLDTNLNTSPYYDDFAANSQHHRVLFKPSVPVQARELTQLQTILQSQIAKFGDNIITAGSIISGCTFTTRSIAFIKLNDRDTAGATYIVGNYSNGYVVQVSSNLSMQTEDTKSGFEITNPEMNTLYGTYINTGNVAGVDKEAFTAGDTVIFYPANGQISNTFTINDGGSAYTNGDTLAFAAERGTNATANVSTNSTGGITTVTLITAGKDYRWDNIPTIAVTSEGGTSANISATINSTASFTVANTTFNKSGNTEFNTVGKTLRVIVSDGVIYQKGHFVEVFKQGVNVKDYDNVPNNYSVGFTTTESIINSSSNSSLLDNASGFNNENAPGADRLKLIPTLVSNTTDNARASNNFLQLIKFENGGPIVIKEDTQYSQIGEEIAKRTFEESGDYVVKPFSFSTEDLASNSTYDNVVLGAGKAYVKGYRNDLIAAGRVRVRKGNDTANVENATVSQSYGNYIIVDELLGSFDFNTGVTVKLLDTAGNRISTCPAGSAETVPTTNTATAVTASAPTLAATIIGTAKVRSVTYEDNTPGTSTGQYRLYLFDVQMNQGRAFSSSRAVSYFTGADAGVGFADVVLTDGSAVLKDTNLRKFIQPLGIKGIKTFNHKAADVGKYTYRTISTGTVQTNGTVVISLTGNQIFDYTASGYLSSDDENEFIIVANNASAQTAVLTGTVATSGNVVTGTSTTFTNDFQVGDTIRVTDAQDELITGITNSIYLTTLTAFSSSVTGKAYRRLYVADKPIHLQNNTAANIQISSDQSSATINMSRGKTLESTLKVLVKHNVQKRESAQRNKLLSANTYVKITGNGNAGGTAGPWSLGVPDVYDIQKVYVKYDNFTSIEAAAYEQTSQFELIRNQQDGFYGLSKLKLKPTASNTTINSTARILVSCRHFVNSGSGFGYYSVDSYPVDDDTETLPLDKIRTQQIPVYASPLDGSTVDLRDSIDFRPQCANTANTTNATTAAGSTTDPANTVSFSSEQYFAAPGSKMTLDYQHYLPRIDKLMMSPQGTVAIIEGSSNQKPVPPQDSAEGMTLAIVQIPVHPSLPSRDARDAGRMDYSYKIVNKQQSNFTMADIGQIKDEVRRIQYYTSLNLLEQQSLSLVIPTAANSSLERFKNGILVDNFQDKTIGSILDAEFKAGYNKATKSVSAKTKSNVVDITPNSYANTVKTGDLITLTYDHVNQFQQRSATRSRNATEAFWQFAGVTTLYPNYDNFMDVRHPPENDFHVELDLTLGASSLLNSIKDIEAIQSPRTDVIGDTSATSHTGTTTSTSVTGTRTVATSGGTNSVQTTQTEVVESYNTIRTITKQNSQNQFNTQEVKNTQPVGEFVRDLSFNPYIREQFVYFHVVGLKKNTRHYAYFDAKDVNANTQPATVATADTVAQDNFRVTGAKGANLVSSNTGELFGVFHLPAKTYAVGERQLLLSDKSTIASSQDSAISTGSAFFNAYNFGIDKSSIQLTTKQIEVTSSRIITGTTVESTSTRTARPTITTRDVIVGFTPTPLPAPPGNFWGITSDDGDTEDAGDDADPLAQTFIIKDKDNAPGMFITKMDLYFETKDSSLGITCQIRTVENGFPAAKILPYGSVHLKSSDVNTSTDGTAVTTVTFPSPIYVAAGLEYCFVLLPDGNNPNYNVWVKKTGESDLTTGTIINADEFDGIMFLSSNNRAWKPLQDEDVKFTIYRANFNSRQGTVDYQNNDHEFLTLGTINGTFSQGERVFIYDNSSNVTGNVSFSSTSETVTGTGSTFSTDLAVGNFIALTNGTSHSVRKVTAIANNTSLTVQGFPDYTSAGVADIQLTPSGEVYYYESTDQLKEMHLQKSSATNSTFKFANSVTIIGSDSEANAVVTTVDDINVTDFENLMYQITPVGSQIKQFAQANTSAGQTSNTSFPMNNRNKLTEVAQIKSLSNEIVGGTGKSWKHTFEFNTLHSFISPVIDDSISNILRYENIINNSNTNEHLPQQGNSTAKYVSRVVTLEDGLDAEDLKVYVTATQPATSQVEVYAKLAHELESDAFIDRHWTRLSKVGTDVQTNAELEDDFFEFEYTLPNTPPATALVGKGLADVANNLIATTDTQASALAAGDLVKIVNTSASTDYQIETVTAVNSTIITVGNDISFDNTQADMFKIDTPQTAFKDPQNSTIVTYYNSAQNKFNTYKAFQIKIVMLSDNAARVPKLQDFRALALSV
jgi:hypothetical protein